MTIAVYAHSTKDNHSAYIEQIFTMLKSEKVNLIIHEPYYNFLKENYRFNISIGTFLNSEELISKADYLICLGGDGTMLETLSLFKNSGIPL